MRRATAKVETLAGALGIILALPLSFAAAAEPAAAHVNSLAEFAQSASVLDAWRDYALANLTLDFSWARDTAAPITAPSLFDRGIAHVAQPASHFAGAGAAAAALSVTLTRSKTADTPLLAANEPTLLQDYSPGLQRYILSPTYVQPWGENSSFGVSAIFAYQRFASFGLGLDNKPTPSGSVTPVMSFEYRNSELASYGSGMRVDFNSAFTDRLSWQVGYQTRVNMDAFNNYRGVYSEPGSFDIPASANIGLGYAVSPDLKFDVGAERVMYSQITPFTSAALPTRFLVLLGSSISPTFAWQDVDVYSIGWTWRDTSDSVWSLHYNTREQPFPTSRLLQSALEPYLASHNIEFGFAHLFGRASSLRVEATYAPSEFVLGLPTNNSLRSNGDGNQVEYQALWTTRF